MTVDSDIDWWCHFLRSSGTGMVYHCSDDGRGDAHHVEIARWRSFALLAAGRGVGGDGEECLNKCKGTLLCCPEERTKLSKMQITAGFMAEFLARYEAFRDIQPFRNVKTADR